LHASPDIRAQIEGFPPLHPRAARDTPIAGVVLTNGELDQCLGLLAMRESQPLDIYATDRVREGFTTGNMLYRTLERFPGQVTWHSLKLRVQDIALLAADGTPSGLVVTAFPVPGKVPLHLEGIMGPDEEDTIGMLIRDARTERTMGYEPCAAEHSPELAQFLQQADCLFFDGTFWSDEELRVLGIGRRRAREMAHWPLSGPQGSVEFLASFPHARRVLIHINNTNPILDEQSPERAVLEAAGIEVAYDGMEIDL